MQCEIEGRKKSARFFLFSSFPWCVCMCVCIDYMVRLGKKETVWRYTLLGRVIKKSQVLFLQSIQSYGYNNIQHERYQPHGNDTRQPLSSSFFSSLPTHWERFMSHWFCYNRQNISILNIKNSLLHLLPVIFSFSFWIHMKL